MTSWKWQAVPCTLTMDNSSRNFCILFVKNTFLKLNRYCSWAYKRCVCWTEVYDDSLHSSQKWQSFIWTSNIHIFLRLCCVCLLGHLNLILLWVVFKIYSSNMYHVIASHNLHSSQVCLIPVLITVLITAVHYSSTHSIYAHSMSSCMHCSVMAVDTEYPLQGMLAVETLPLVNVCTHRVPVEYGTAWWLSASCSSLWHSHGFLPAMEN